MGREPSISRTCKVALNHHGEVTSICFQNTLLHILWAQTKHPFKQHCFGVVIFIRSNLDQWYYLVTVSIKVARFSRQIFKIPKGRHHTTYCIMVNHNQYRVNMLIFTQVKLKQMFFLFFFFNLSKCRNRCLDKSNYSWFTVAVDNLVSAQPEFLGHVLGLLNALCRTKSASFVSIKSCISLHSGINRHSNYFVSFLL